MLHNLYDRGLGTGLRGLLAKATGFGISKNIRDCYQFIFENFQSDDRILLFGFSRGATTVRSLSGFIHLFGILPKSRPELVKQAYKIYKIRDHKKREQRAKDFVNQHHVMWCNIEFMGVWDTVAALGIPIKFIDIIIDKISLFRHRFHNLSLSKSVKYACHALAIDDQRKTFHPVLWIPESRVKQVWFSGMHTDVGGGYPKQDLSDITLEWMVNNATEYGLKIYKNHKVKINPNPNGHMHNSRGKGLSRFYRNKVRSWSIDGKPIEEKPIIHPHVLDRQLNENNEAEPTYSSWILGMEYDVES